MRRLSHALLALLLALLSSSACRSSERKQQARPAPPPIGRLSPADSEVLRRAIARVGGEAALRQVKSLRMLGSLEGQLLFVTHVVNFDLEAGRRAFVVSLSDTAGFRQHNYITFASPKTAGENFNNRVRLPVDPSGSDSDTRRELLVYLHPVFLLRHLGTAAADARVSDESVEASKLAVVISLPTKRTARLVFDRASAALLEVRSALSEGNYRFRTIRFDSWFHYPLWPKGLKLPLCTIYEPYRVWALRSTTASGAKRRPTREKLCTFTILVNDPPVSLHDIVRDVNTNVGFPSAMGGYGQPSNWP